MSIRVPKFSTEAEEVAFWDRTSITDIHPDDIQEMSRDDGQEDFCHRCGGPNPTWSAASPLWNEVMRGGDINADHEPFDGIVCPLCFIALAQEKGIADFWWLDAQFTNVPLQTVTPSGRVWNRTTFMYEDEPPTDNPTQRLVFAARKLAGLATRGEWEGWQALQEARIECLAALDNLSVSS